MAPSIPTGVEDMHRPAESVPGTGNELGEVMNFDKLFNILGMIVTVALVTTIVSHSQSAAVIKAMGSAFSGSIKAALGK